MRLLNNTYSIHNITVDILLYILYTFPIAHVGRVSSKVNIAKIMLQVLSAGSEEE